MTAGTGDEPFGAHRELPAGDRLQAAAHMGNREIAGFLLHEGAPLDICAAAMLGKRNNVEAFLGEVGFTRVVRVTLDGGVDDPVVTATGDVVFCATKSPSP